MKDFGANSVWLVLMLALVPPDANTLWRISAHTLAALVSGLICYVLIMLLLDRDAGHRQINCVALVYFVGRVIMHGWIALDFTYGIPHVPTFISTMSASTEVAFGVCYYVARHDIANTYRRSEAVRRENIHDLENIAQKAILLEYQARKNAADSHLLTEMIANVGRGAGRQ